MESSEQREARREQPMSAVTLPSAQRVVLRDISWETYERLLKDLEDCSAPRLTFDRGVLEIMSPFSDHEENNRNLALLVEVFAEEFGLEVRNLGSTTFKREEFERGFEPDSCFYIQSESQIRDRRRIDLSVDPPPDLVIEIDLTNDSIDKFPLFAKLGIPEVWRVQKDRLEIFTRKGSSYHRQDTSAALPLLTAKDLTEFLELSLSMRRIAWLRHIRTRFRRLKRTLKTTKS
jgi:Uma2 family endonuclease